MLLIVYLTITLLMIRASKRESKLQEVSLPEVVSSEYSLFLEALVTME
jgi:hypothetical protein